MSDTIIIDGFDTSVLSPDDAYRFYRMLGERIRDKYSAYPTVFFTDLENARNRHADTVMDDAIRNLIGSGADELIERYGNDSMYFVENHFNNMLDSEFEYMPNNYDADECLIELVDASCYFYEQAPDDVRDATNDIINIWTGADGFVGFLQEIIDNR